MPPRETPMLSATSSFKAPNARSSPATARTGEFNTSRCMVLRVVVRCSDLLGARSSPARDDHDCRCNGYEGDGDDQRSSAAGRG
jgi:hypothetical protein